MAIDGEMIERADSAICHISSDMMAKCRALHELTDEQTLNVIKACINPDISQKSGDPMFYGHVDGKEYRVQAALVKDDIIEFEIKSVYPVRKSKKMQSDKTERRIRYERRKKNWRK